MAVYQVRGITLKHQDSREVDRIITLYTRQLGKHTAIARGSRKISSKLAGSLEPFTEAEFSCAQGARIDTITGVDALDAYRQLRSDPDRILVASYCAMILDAATKDHQRDDRIYELLRHVLRTLDTPTVSPRVLFIIRWFFIWRLFQILGHQPELFYDRHTRRALQGEQFMYDPDRGVLAGRGHSSALSLSKSSVKLLRIFHTQSLEQSLAIRFTTAVAQEIERVTQYQVNYVLEGDYSFAPFFIQ